MANNDHNGYETSDGTKVPRITEVIGFIAKDSIALWANFLGFKHIRYKDELDRTANVGTAVHEVLEAINDPDQLASIDNAIDSCHLWSFRDQLEMKNAVYSFFCWYRENFDKYKPIAFEKTIVGSRVGGTLDVILRGIKDPDKVIIGDYKTSKELYFTHMLQLAGYVGLYEEVYGEDTVEGIVLFRLDKKEGEKAETLFITRVDLSIFMEAFDLLLTTSTAVNALQKRNRWKTFGKKLEDIK